MIDQVQSSADQLVDWAKYNDMDFNVSKTKVMIFGNSSDKVKTMIEGSEIEQASSYKYFGVILDTGLDFGHAVGKAKRASTKVFSLIDGRHGISVHIGIILYNRLVRPHLEYAFPVWDRWQTTLHLHSYSMGKKSPKIAPSLGEI